MKKIILFLIVFAICSNTKAQEFWENVSIPVENFRCFAVNSESTMFLGISNGLYRSTDDGEMWENVLYDDYGVYAVSISTNNRIFATMRTASCMAFSDDNGLTWEYKPLSYNVYDYTNIYCVNDSILFLYGDSMRDFICTYDCGDTWENVYVLTPPTSNPYVSDIVVATNGDVYVSMFSWGGYSPYSLGVYKSSDRCQTWSHVAFNDYSITDLAITSNDDVFAALVIDWGQYDNCKKRYEQYYGLWTDNIVITEDDRIFITGSTLLCSSDYGETFEPIGEDFPISDPPVVGEIGTLYLGNNNHIFLIGDNYIIKSVQPIPVTVDENYDITEGDNISIFPNPVKNIINITCNFHSDDISGYVEILDIFGKRHFNNQFDNIKDFCLDISTLRKGVYFISIVSDNVGFTKKIIKN